MNSEEGMARTAARTSWSSVASSSEKSACSPGPLCDTAPRSALHTRTDHSQTHSQPFRWRIHTANAICSLQQADASAHLELGEGEFEPTRPSMDPAAARVLSRDLLSVA